MLTSRYMVSAKNIPTILEAIVNGTAPPKFTSAHLKSIGFKSSNDHAIIALLKDLGFLTQDGAPTTVYHAYRDRARSRQVLGQALKATYEDLFHVKENPTESDRKAIEGKFKSTHNVSDRVAKEQASTFFALLKLADLDSRGIAPRPQIQSHDKKAMKEGKGSGRSLKSEEESFDGAQQNESSQRIRFSGLHYNIEIHLPSTKDPEVFNAIFKSLKEHILDS